LVKGRTQETCCYLLERFFSKIIGRRKPSRKNGRYNGRGQLVDGRPKSTSQDYKDCYMEIVQQLKMT